MKKLLVAITFSAYSLIACGQNLAKPISRPFDNKNSFQFELFGHGLLYSLNYERILSNGNKFKTTAQAGFSYYPPSTGLRTFWIPFSINKLLSFTHHHLELGIGHIFTNDNSLAKSKFEPLGSFRVGYRYQKPESKFLFRVGFTPVIEYVSSLELRDWRYLEVYPLGGLALGYSF